MRPPPQKKALAYKLKDIKVLAGSPTSYKAVYEVMRPRMIDLIPDFEIQEKARLVFEINKLKKDRNAIILGHNYMEPALYHFVADERGDSLELCRKAAASQQDIIVFLGVEFMAETAKVLNPTRKVLIPSQKAGCSLAASITAEDVRELKRRYPGVPVATYINTYADVKAETDVCVTSSNAAHIVSNLNSDTVIFIPDEYLARNVARETDKKIIFPETNPTKMKAEAGIEKTFIGWHGKCEVHDNFTVDDITNARKQFQDVVVLAHPECPPAVAAAADFSGSTSAMIKYVKEHPAGHYLLLTECSMADNIIAESPASDILRLCSVRCPHMAQITLQDTLECLQDLKYEINVAEDIRVKAKRSIDRMLEMSK